MPQSLPFTNDEALQRSMVAVSAIMLDRDGVINRELGHFVRSWGEFEFLPGVLDALRELSSLAVPIVVVSNQSAIGRGWTSLHEVDAINRQMLDVIRSAGGRIDDILICPHAPEAGCACRKPQPGLLLMAAEKHRFDLRRAMMIGDLYRDVQAAQAVGAVPILVRSGHSISPDLEALLHREHVRLVPNLVAAAEAILDANRIPS